jgi:hypothetical protein
MLQSYVQSESDLSNFMAKLAGAGRIYDAARIFRERALTQGQSFLWPDRKIWIPENLSMLSKVFMTHAGESKPSFLEKLQGQLLNASEDIHRLAADVLAFYFLFPADASKKSKLEDIQTIVGWKLSHDVPNYDLLLAAYDTSVGRTGLPYIRRRPLQLAFYLIFAREVLVRHIDTADPVACRKLADEVAESVPYGIAARHVLLHLLHPDFFERIASSTQKKTIQQVFAAYAGNAQDTDTAIRNIRAGLAIKLGKPDFDFYDEPEVRSQWLGDSGAVHAEADFEDGIPAAYLLAWNPKNFEWPELASLATGLQTASPQAKLPQDQWTVSNGRIKPGDRLFLIRLGEEPKGIVGQGRAISSPFERPHFSGEAGKTAQAVDLEWEILLDPAKTPILPLSLLQVEIPQVHWATQSSGIEIPADQQQRLEVLWQQFLRLRTKPAEVQVDLPAYTVDEALDGVFMEREAFTEILELARARKNIVLQGPPGVGKTFLAKRIAFALMGTCDEDRVESVQFHQSYSYEDFIQGFRPSASQFILTNGIFYEFCDRARRDRRDHVFIIDEINRGNLSRIFGEALSLLEADKRGGYGVRLAYSGGMPTAGGPISSAGSVSGLKFNIPQNIYLIGLMNTADRSLAVVDYALRRRFAFIDIEPRFHDGRFAEHLEKMNVPSGLRNTIIDRVSGLNERIRADKRNLGRGFEIGHSFFCPAEPLQDAEQWYRRVIQFEIKPLLREYWFDKPDKAFQEVARLMGEDSD